MRKSDPRGGSQKYVFGFTSRITFTHYSFGWRFPLSDHTFRLHFWIRLSDHSFIDCSFQSVFWITILDTMNVLIDRFLSYSLISLPLLSVEIELLMPRLCRNEEINIFFKMAELHSSQSNSFLNFRIF